MGMTIDKCIDIWTYPTQYFPSEREKAMDFAIDTMRRYQQLQADYENRLKADLKAILTDLSMKIGEIEDGYVEFDEENKRSLTMIPLEIVERLIDREINSLKEA